MFYIPIIPLGKLNLKLLPEAYIVSISWKGVVFLECDLLIGFTLSVRREMDCIVRLAMFYKEFK